MIPCLAVDPQMFASSDILGRQDLAVAQPSATDPLEEAQHRGVSIGAVRDEQVAVLGSTDVPVIDHAEPPDNYVVQPDRVGVAYDTGEVRTRELF